MVTNKYDHLKISFTNNDPFILKRFNFGIISIFFISPCIYYELFFRLPVVSNKSSHRKCSSRLLFQSLSLLITLFEFFRKNEDLKEHASEYSCIAPGTIQGKN